jgi:two-component system sensor histidine kinase UhpB
VNLRLRITLLILALLVVGVVTVVGQSIDTAREEISSEVESTRTLVTQLLAMVNNPQYTSDNDALSQDFIKQLASLTNVRHFDVDIVGPGDQGVLTDESGESKLEAPEWFTGMLSLGENLEIGSYRDENGSIIIIRTDPTDEINEVWAEASASMSARLSGLVVFNLLVYLILGYWLRPVPQIINGLESVVKGDYSHRIPKAGLPELNSIIEMVNKLTGVLGSTRVENERLAIQSLTIQEQERRRLAQELHDSLGQSVSAIKAMAVSINMRTRDSDPMLATNARNIEKISEEAYKSVRDMMAWLRPAVLDELGLELALQQMVDDWNVHHEDTFCRLNIDGDFSGLDEHQRINLFRIVQECLTNIAKYAHAEKVDIALSGKEIITLQIRDDGLGFDQEKAGKGMGLGGMRNRVTSLQGTFELTTRPGKGTIIQIEIPRHPQPGRMERRRATDFPLTAPAPADNYEI